MYFVFCVNVLIVFLAFISNSQRYKVCIYLSLLLLWLLFTCRFNYGNDYQSYRQIFNDANSYSITDSLFSLKHYQGKYDVETGWIILCRLFNPIGFGGLNMILAFINVFTLWMLMRQYVDKSLYWYTLLLYVFSSDFMLIQMSMERQTLVMMLSLLFIELLKRKKYIFSLLLFFIAIQIHTTAYIYILIFFLFLLNISVTKSMIYLFIVTFTVLVYSAAYLSIEFNTLVTLLFSKYERYEIVKSLDDVSFRFNSSFWIMCFFIFMLIRNVKERTSWENYFIISTLIMYLFSSLVWIIPVLYRVQFYFLMSILVTYPLIVRNENKYIRNTFLILTSGLSVYNFFVFHQDPIFREAYSTYQIIFFS